MTPLRLLHVGVGRRGVWPLEVARADDRWVSVGVVDHDETLLYQAKELLGLPASACFTDTDIALVRTNPDAVVICTPTRTHRPLCRTCFAAGKHVLVEKGMTCDLTDARRLVAEAEAAGVRFCVGQNYRYTTLHRTLKAALEDGSVGRPAFFDLIHHRARTEPRTLDYPAAVLWDMGCHHLDDCLNWFGPLTAVNARLFDAPWSKYADPQGVRALLEFASGVSGTYELTHIAQADHQRLEIHTTAGRVRLYDVEGVEFRPTAGATATVPSAPPARSEALLLEAFRRYIVDGEEPPVSGRQNLAVLTAIAALIESDRRGGGRVTVDEV